MQNDPFHNAPDLSGSSVESLLASFGSHRFFLKTSPPDRHAAFRWRSDIVAGPGISIWRTQYSADWSYSSETSKEDLAVGFLSAGAADIVVGARAAQRTPSTAALMALPALQHHKIHAVDGSYASVMLRFDAAVVARVLTAMFDGPALTKLDLAPVVDLSTGVGRTLHLLARTIVSGMHDGQPLQRSPKAMALLTEASLRLIFENVPHRLSPRLDRERLNVAPRHTHQAIDFMHANMHRPLTAIDIAEAVGVGVRSLQAGFRQHKDTTPVGYLRRIRLQTAHAELSSPENRLPVSEVALKWGFTQMGRFAAQYRAMFGVYPSETASRARGRL